jgi:hypothetical protein
MHATRKMDMHSMDGTVFMTILSIGFYFVTVILGDINLASVITLQSMAGLAAICAGFSTLAYNLYRFYRDYKQDNQNKKGSKRL